jgi:hypothetical protein
LGVLMNVSPEHPEGQPFVAAFRQALQQLGWTERAHSIAMSAFDPKRTSDAPFPGTSFARYDG